MESSASFPSKANQDIGTLEMLAMGRCVWGITVDGRWLWIFLTFLDILLSLQLIPEKKKMTWILLWTMGLFLDFLKGFWFASSPRSRRWTPESWIIFIQYLTTSWEKRCVWERERRQHPRTLDEMKYMDPFPSRFWSVCGIETTLLVLWMISGEDGMEVTHPSLTRLDLST